MANTTSTDTAKKAGIGLGVLAAAAAAGAAGYYFYASKDAKENRRIAAKWANDLKADAVRNARKLQNADREDIMAVIDKAVSAYEGVRTINSKDLLRVAHELKTHWKMIAQEAVGRMSTSAKRTSTANKTTRAKKSSSRKSVQ